MIVRIFLGGCQGVGSPVVARVIWVVVRTLLGGCQGIASQTVAWVLLMVVRVLWMAARSLCGGCRHVLRGCQNISKWLLGLFQPDSFSGIVGRCWGVYGVLWMFPGLCFVVLA